MYRFSTFLKCAQQIEAIALIQSRKSKIELLKQTLNTYQKQQQIQFLQFMLAQIESPLNNVQIVIPEYSLFQALSLHYQIPYQTIKEMDGEVGDLSQVASQLMQNKTQSVQFDLIFHKLKQIYLTVGNGSQIIKEDQIKELLQLCSTQLEIKYLIRFLQKKMRIGLSTKGVSKVIDESLNQLILGYQRNSSDFGIPILPMLAKSYTYVPELVDDFIDKKDNKYYCEYKYDGERLQVHYQDDQVQLYGRSLECKTTKFPNLTLALQNQLSCVSGLKSAIFDCEMICYKEGKIIPFQDMQFKAIETSDQLSLVCFDILMWNSQTLIDSPYSQRMKAYKSILPAITNQRQLISHINSIQFTNKSELQLLFDQALIEGLEGLIVKRDVPYTPGLRSDWAKLKKDKDVDLALIGAYYGKGKRRQLYGSFLLGVYDELNEAIQPITKIGTGFSDQDLKNFTQKYVPVQADGMVVSKPKPDVYFPIGTVWEVKYDIISMSPTYQIKNENFQGGLSLRFPRFIRERPDKSVTQCMTVDLLIEEYFKKVL